MPPHTHTAMPSGRGNSGSHHRTIAQLAQPRGVDVGVAATARSSRKARHLIRHQLTMPPVAVCRHRHRLLAHSQRLRLTLPHMVSTRCRSSKTSLCSSKTYVLATLNCISNAYRARVAESLGAPSLTTCHVAVQVVLEVRELTAIAFRTGGTFYFAPVDDEESAKENARMAVDVVMAAMNAVPRSTGQSHCSFSHSQLHATWISELTRSRSRW